MKKNNWPIVFGPVPSRRLGRSLGIDLTPPKTCSFDCIYCECGKTTRLSIKRELFLDPDKVIWEVDGFFNHYDPSLVDAITFSGAGEPTLYSELGSIIAALKARHPEIPVGVLTNGSLLWDSTVRADLGLADFVIPSLDAPNEELFRTINRPHKELKWDQYLDGLRRFIEEYRGDFRLEILFVKGVNDSDKVISEFRNLLQWLNPKIVEINTISRPGTKPHLQGLPQEQLLKIARMLAPVRCRVVSGYKSKNKYISYSESRIDERIIALLIRRPCVIEEMADSLAIPSDVLKVHLNKLVKDGKICFQHGFYRAVSPLPTS